jgi:hypothetical protein
VGAIVPGYGVADAVEQALGGWFGFGLHGWIVREMAQSALAYSAPQIANIGRGFMMTVRNHKRPETGAPLFDHGSGSADVLYAILDQWSALPAYTGTAKGRSSSNALSATFHAKEPIISRLPPSAGRSPKVRPKRRIDRSSDGSTASVC